MGQRPRHHLELAQKERGDEMGWQKRAGTRLTSFQAVPPPNRQDLLPLALERRGPQRSARPLTQTPRPCTCQVCWTVPPRPPRGQPQRWGVCWGRNSVSRGLERGLRQVALGSGPRVQRRKAQGSGPRAGFGTGRLPRGLETRGLRPAPRRSRWAPCWT